MQYIILLCPCFFGMEGHIKCHKHIYLGLLLTYERYIIRCNYVLWHDCVFWFGPCSLHFFHMVSTLEFISKAFNSVRPGIHMSSLPCPYIGLVRQLCGWKNACLTYNSCDLLWIPCMFKYVLISDMYLREVMCGTSNCYHVRIH